MPLFMVKKEVFEWINHLKRKQKLPYPLKPISRQLIFKNGKIINEIAILDFNEMKYFKGHERLAVNLKQIKLDLTKANDSEKIRRLNESKQAIENYFAEIGLM